MNPERHLPLRSLDLVVLLSLEAEPLHGYALLSEVVRRSDGFIAPGPASLYRTVGHLEDAGMLEETDAADGSTDPRRRTFRLTAFGSAVLRAELRRLDALLAMARDLRVRYQDGR